MKPAWCSPSPKSPRLVREAGALLLVDAVPAAGKIGLDFSLCDYMALSAHKIGGPQGGGALVVRDRRAARPQLVGGGQQKGLRAGTENLVRHRRLWRRGPCAGRWRRRARPHRPSARSL